ncbi:hypothetical protein ABIC83_003006 [Roseateles asaccharophilus]|uniref:hypothetical protein n=1 Tax=Roseateles asaccharophilus TaxID=582607 RepID=UPI003832D0AE
MKIKSFSPCSDWFFVFQDTQGKTVNYRLSGFAVIEDDTKDTDRVVGMVAVTGGGDSSAMPGTCALSTVPPVVGTYKHLSEIDAPKASS